MATALGNAPPPMPVPPMQPSCVLNEGYITTKSNFSNPQKIQLQNTYVYFMYSVGT